MMAPRVIQHSAAVPHYFVSRLFVLTMTLAVAIYGNDVTAAEVDWESILIQQEDLPEGTTPGQISYKPPFAGRVPGPELGIYRQFLVGGKHVGGVSVFVYPAEDTRARLEAYDKLLQGMLGVRRVRVGELGVVSEKSLKERLRETLARAGDPPDRIQGSVDMVSDMYDLIFRRCRIVVHIRMVVSSVDGIERYATRLDERLKAAC